MGTVPPEQVPECYAAADIFVSASTTETQGLTYFEALSCGTPVLCREDDCIRGVVEDGKNGYLFRDYQSFANGLHCLTEGDLSSMSEACRAAAEEFSLEKICRARGETVPRFDGKKEIRSCFLRHFPARKRENAANALQAQDFVLY